MTAVKFHKSVDHINSVVGPVKNVLFGIESNFPGTYKVKPKVGTAVFALTNIVLQPLYLAFAYPSYWPAKGLAKLTDKFGLKDSTELLVGYSHTLSKKADEASEK